MRSLLIVSTAVLVGTACNRPPRPLAPLGMIPMSRDTARAWVAELAPTELRRYDLRWRFQNQQASVAGRGAVRLAPPDSLRFDYRAPFGRSGAAVVVDDEVIWREPEDGVQLIPVVALFWAALGIPRLPPVGSKVMGLADGDRRIWQYLVDGDTLTYVVRSGSLRLQAEIRQPGRLVGTVDVRFDPETHLPTQATLTFPEKAAILRFTVEEIEELASLDADIWKRP